MLTGVVTAIIGGLVMAFFSWLDKRRAREIEINEARLRGLVGSEAEVTQAEKDIQNDAKNAAGSASSDFSSMR